MTTDSSNVILVEVFPYMSVTSGFVLWEMWLITVWLTFVILQCLPIYNWTLMWHITSLCVWVKKYKCICDLMVTVLHCINKWYTVWRNGVGTVCTHTTHSYRHVLLFIYTHTNICIYLCIHHCTIHINKYTVCMDICMQTFIKCAMFATFHPAYCSDVHQRAFFLLCCIDDCHSRLPPAYPSSHKFCPSVPLPLSSCRTPLTGLLVYISIQLIFILRLMPHLALLSFIGNQFPSMHSTWPYKAANLYVASSCRRSPESYSTLVLQSPIFVTYDLTWNYINY